MSYQVFGINNYGSHGLAVVGLILIDDDKEQYLHKIQLVESMQRKQARTWRLN